MRTEKHLTCQHRFNYYISLGNRALAHRMVGRTNEALATLDRTLQLSPSYSPGLAGKVLCLAGLGRWQEARDVHEKLRALYPFVTLELDLAGSTGPMLGRIAQENAVLMRQLWEDAPTS